VIRGRSLLLIYAAFIVYGATIPFAFAPDLALPHLRSLLDGAVSTMDRRHVSLPDLVQNLIFFAPFGLLWVLADPRTNSRWTRVASGVAAAFVLSIAIEALQLFTADRVSSLSDVAANTAGAAAGATVAWIARRHVARVNDAVRGLTLRARQKAWPLAAAGIAVGTSMFEPFDATLEVGSVYSRLKSFLADPWQLSPWRDEVRMALLWALFMMALASYLRAAGRARPARDAVIAAGSCAVAAELAQFGIGSRMPGLWDVGVSLAGVLAGLVVWGGAWLAGPRTRQTAILLVTAVAAGVETLSPFTLASQYRTIALLPFYGAYGHTTMETLSHVIETGLIYAPLGFCWRLAEPDGTSDRRTLTWVLVLTAAIAAPLELAQGWIDGRYPDISDVGLALLAAAAGALSAAYPPQAFRHAPARIDSGGRPPAPRTR
jgi:glycopeptide antibiotics resistance protein